jgi:hypothetical protein
MKEDFTLELLGKDHSYMAPLDLSFIAVLIVVYFNRVLVSLYCYQHMPINTK